MNKANFYKDSEVVEVEWWLSWCHEYPDLFWARLRVFANARADVAFQGESKTFGFNDKEFAHHFVSEDEFSLFENVNEEDKKDLEIPPDVVIELPTWAEKNCKEFEYIGDY